VVEPGHTPKPALRHALGSLNRVGAHVLGAVFNKVRTELGGYSYHYDYGSGEASVAAESANGSGAVQAPTEGVRNTTTT